MKNLVSPLQKVLSGNGDLSQVGEILHENWQLKKSLTNLVSSNEVDNYYNQARKAGAIGGKLLGAGGGGFLMFYVEPEKQQDVINTLSGLSLLKIKLDSSGTRITYYDQMSNLI
jgi:D-glycero-alpha-D-manno-heptose-7-phosphate kinase